MLKPIIIALLIPVSLLGLSLLLIPWADSLAPATVAILHYLPYAALAVSMVLSLSFNQTRLFFGLLLTMLFLVLLLGDAAYLSFMPALPKGVVIQLIGVLYPVSLILFMFMKERGLLTLAGLLRLLFVSLLAVSVVLLAHYQPVPVLSGWLDYTFLHPAVGSLTPLSDLVVVSHVTALLIIILRIMLRGGVVASSFLAMLLASSLELHLQAPMLTVQIVTTAAALSVIITILRNSLQLAYRDELTDLPTRRALRDQLLKLGRRYSIAMVDIDHFKRFNDRYGHDVGDQVLKMVATHLARAGGGSRAFRYGGEEFTLVFSGKHAEQAEPYLESLRKEIADAKFVVRNKPRKKSKPGRKRKTKRSSSSAAGKKTVSVRVSIGLDDNSKGHKTPEQVIKAADKALYRAKKKGRNRVCRQGGAR
jgi:diguanylate cyclase (GGDEF)-like protein